MAITREEVAALAEAFWETARCGGAAPDQAAFFLFEARVYVLETGATFSMEEHERFHAQFDEEEHVLGDLVVVPLSDEPERARATGTVYWRARYRDRSRGEIRAVVGEDFVVERAPSGEVRFVLYLNTFHHFLPGAEGGGIAKA